MLGGGRGVGEANGKTNEVLLFPKESERLARSATRAMRRDCGLGSAIACKCQKVAADIAANKDWRD